MGSGVRVIGGHYRLIMENHKEKNMTAMDTGAIKGLSNLDSVALMSVYRVYRYRVEEYYDKETLLCTIYPYHGNLV